MHQQIRLQVFNQIQPFGTSQFRMHRCARELKRSARAGGEDVRVPAVSFVGTPHVEHALSAADGEVPRHEVDQSRTAVARPRFCELFYRGWHSSPKCLVRLTQICLNELCASSVISVAPRWQPSFTTDAQRTQRWLRESRSQVTTLAPSSIR